MGSYVNNKRIEEFRYLIDRIDERICKNLKMRKSIVEDIQSLKEEGEEKDPEREQEIKDRLISKYPEMEDTIKVLWNHLFNNVQNNS
jgi:chorismate mutase